jgi:cytochrome c553
MVNTFVYEDGKKWLVAKNSGKLLPMISPSEICTSSKAHKNVSCDACHTAWVPQCIGCHNVYEKNTPGFDMLENRDKMGTWVEFTGKFYADAPVLGVDERQEMKDSKPKRISTFTNGMVLSIDLQSFDSKSGTKEVFRRLHAPTAAHTTAPEGRSCKSCHNNPLAIGYGRGVLEFVAEGKTGHWQFTPHFANNKFDNLPEDAWIGFLEVTNSLTSTREGVRPFNIAEQKRILEVGACLTCHEEDSKAMLETMDDFDGLLNRLTEKCSKVVW